jgi:hypothetical protein
MIQGMAELLQRRLCFSVPFCHQPKFHSAEYLCYETRSIIVNLKTSLISTAGLLVSIQAAHGGNAEQTPRGPAPNPFLAAEKYAITHFDAAQTDAMPYPAPRGTFHINLRDFPRVVGGPVNIMQLASTSPNYMWGASSGGISYIDVSDGGFRTVAQYATPGLVNIVSSKLDSVLSQRFTSISEVENAVSELGVNFSRLANNTYVLVDRDNVLYAAAGTRIYAYGLVDPKDPAKGIQILRELDLTDHIQELVKEGGDLFAKYGAFIVGASLTYDGKLIVLTNGSLTILDRSFEGARHTVRFAANEYITNSLAVDEKNGIYVATDRKMHKLVWTGSKLSQEQSDGAWSAAYDTGREAPSVKFGLGTGSTPTLMGFGADQDKLVVITDGADRMKLVAFWRDEIPADAKTEAPKSPRIADEIQVTAGLSPLPEFIQSEQSVVAKGYGAFVVNNIRPEGHPDKLIDVLAGGPVFAPPSGMERFEWDPVQNLWRSVWSRGDVVSTSMVPSVSIPSNIVFVNGYTSQDGWELTGMDWNTGRTVHRSIFGQDNLGNGAYAIVQFLQNGDALFNSVGGPTRVKLSTSESR